MQEGVKLLPCPFCGSKSIAFSDKTTNVSWVRKRHVAMYCKKCNCYGARTLIDEFGFANRDGKDNSLNIASAAWNRRAPSGLTNQDRPIDEMEGANDKA